MTIQKSGHAHVIAGGFPPGAPAGHDHDYARLRLLQLLYDKQAPTSVSSDFSDLSKWLTRSQFLITYTAGPYPDEDQDRALRQWLEEGGRWLALHGTSGGRAVRVEGTRQRRMLRGSFHDTLGGFFLNHPPVRRFQVDVRDTGHPLTRGLPPAFEVVDEPYMVAVDPSPATRVLLTSELGPDISPPGFGFVYDEDTALLPDGKTRVIGYSRATGEGEVAYFTLGHCHTPASNSQPFVDATVDPEGRTPLTLRHTWETAAFGKLLQNAMEWGLAP
jgi:hypothetical protein